MLSTGVSALLQGLVFAISGFSGTAVRQINRALYAGADFATDPSLATPRFAMFFLFLCLPGIAYLLSALPYRKGRNPHKAPVLAPPIRCSHQNLYKKAQPLWVALLYFVRALY